MAVAAGVSVCPTEWLVYISIDILGSLRAFMYIIHNICIALTLGEGARASRWESDTFGLPYVLSSIDLGQLRV